MEQQEQQNQQLLTNATVVDDAVRFASSNKSKDNLRSLGDNNEIDKEESNEPDYDDEYKDQLEEEQQAWPEILVNMINEGNLINLLFWDLFFITDYLIMASALFWYNRFHISNELKKSSRIKL